VLNYQTLCESRVYKDKIKYLLITVIVFKPLFDVGQVSNKAYLAALIFIQILEKE